MGLASILLVTLDILAVLAAGYLGTRVYSAWLAPPDLPFSAWSVQELTALVAGAVLAALSLKDPLFGARACRGETAALVRRYTGGFALFAGAGLFIAFASRSLDSLPAGWLALYFGGSILLTAMGRLLLARTVRRLERGGLLTEVIAVVGAGPLADRLVGHLRGTRGGQLSVLGVFDDAPPPAGAGSNFPAGTIAELLELGRTRPIDWVLVALPCSAEEPHTDLIRRLQVLGSPIGLCPGTFGVSLACRPVDYVGDGIPVTVLADRPIRRSNALIKSAEDLLLGLFITVLLLPVLAIIAVAIRLDSAGPVIFRQRRHACNNREFDVYKFRTMSWAGVAAPGELKQTSRNDSRITRIGRFLRASSLDELPQLFNVLQGDMSLVGPRPHAVNMRTENQLGGEISQSYAHRHRVKPGMTGWSQVNGSRGATDTTDQLRRRVTLDLRYVDNWSLGLDLKILAMTIPEVLKRTNAY